MKKRHTAIDAPNQFNTLLRTAAIGIAVLLGTTSARAQEAGSIIGWGEQVVGADLSEGLVAVAGGSYHSLGVKVDGSIVAWGWNVYAQCNVQAPNMKNMTTSCTAAPQYDRAPSPRTINNPNSPATPGANEHSHSEGGR